MTSHDSRFRSTVPYYSRYRLAYPPRLIERVIGFCGLREGDAVLDLGSGPGLLAVPLAAAGMRVTAADPEPVMLEAAGAAAAEAGVTLTLWRGGSDDLTPVMGPYRAVTMGRSFHWMDRGATLTRLDRLVTHDGAIVLFHDEHPRTVENRWLPIALEIANRYGRAEEPVISERRTAQYRSHESHLLASPFNVLEAISVVIRKPISVEEIVGRMLSMSTCSPEKLGEKIGAFESDLRDALAGSAQLTEIAALSALIARRS
jgi:SAM-dependent methyltransferase